MGYWAKACGVCGDTVCKGEGKLKVVEVSSTPVAMPIDNDLAVQGAGSKVAPIDAGGRDPSAR